MAVLILPVVATLFAVVAVAIGRGGQLAEFGSDVPPLDLPDAAVDSQALAALRIPVVAPFGYHRGTVDQVLSRAVRALTEREARIALLEERVAELEQGGWSDPEEQLVAGSVGPGTDAEESW